MVKCNDIMKYFQKIKKENRGIATLEMLIALTIITMVISSVILLVFGSQGTTVSSQTNQEALYKAQQQIERARATARADFNDSTLNPGTVTTYDTSGITYTKNLTVTPSVDGLTKLITSLIQWGTNSVSLSTQVTDWFSAGGICNPTISGDWTQPQGYGYFDFPSSKGASGVALKNNIAYVTSDPSSASTDDFYTIDVSDPTLRPLTRLGHFSTTYGLTDIATVITPTETYSYVSAHSATAQLLVIDVSNPNTPPLDVTKIKKQIDVTTTGDTAYGNTIFYINNKIYLGLTNSDGPEFYVFCIAPDPDISACSPSSPINPVQIGSYEVGAEVNRILVRDDFAYISTATTPSNYQVIKLNINLGVPSYVDSYMSSSFTGQALALNKATNTLYFGKKGGTGNPRLFALNTSNLNSPFWNANISDSIYTLIRRGNLLFMTTGDSNDGLQIWDISSAGPVTTPTRYDTSPLNIQQGATVGSSCVGNLLYIAQKSNRALQIVGPFIPITFDYTFSTPPGNIILVQGGPSQTTSFTISKLSGTPVPVDFSDSGLTSGVTMSYSNNPCSPSPNRCSNTLTLSASASATLGTNLVTINGTSPTRSVSFNVTVNSPSFAYTLSTPPDISVVFGGPTVPVVETVTMASGAPQLVTLTAPNPDPTTISISASPLTCTPNATPPYTCSVTFQYSAISTSHGNFPNQRISGSPNSVLSNRFRITAN